MASPKRERAITARARSSAVKNRRRKPDNREPSTRGIARGGGGCWCGEPSGHSWPGKDSGKPHPR